MIGALAALLSCQLLGEIIAQLAGLPVPGPVIGMALLFAALSWRGAVPAPLRAAGEELLRHLSLLFVPAGTGIMLQFGRLRAEWLPILASLVLSSILTIAVTAIVFRLVARWIARP
jgi:holin-like protein